ncbi:MAG: dienelactone hydrolase family protein [Candidatus Protochlamydia sp.]|nr:dienelactone hydrolase family protein [Candidatus Protochlamydia sp.]
MKQLVHVKDAEVNMEGMLKIPPSAQGIVLFAHGSGSSRFSPRNNFVADILNQAGLGTLLIDLLSKEEGEIYQTRFDINLLTDRLSKVIEWLQTQAETKNLLIGLFGSSTGAAAALEVASAMDENIKAVVSRGGRPDLAISVLDNVTAPTLIIVGGNDYGVIELNQKAFEQLACIKKFEVIPDATHLFEEPGCLEEVARLAKEWFHQYLVKV